MKEIQFPFKKNVLLTGRLGLGKTTTLYQWAGKIFGDDLLPVISFERLAFSPAFFAIGYINSICQYHLGLSIKEQTSEKQRIHIPESLGKYHLAYRKLSRILEILSREDLDNKQLLEEVFSFPQCLAEDLGHEIILLLDDCEALNILSNYPNVREPILHFMKSVNSQSRVRYLLGADYPYMINQLFEKNRSTLDSFELLQLEPLTTEETVALTVAKLGHPLPPGMIYGYTGGVPLYTQIICEGVQDSLSEDIYQNAEKVLPAVFFKELLKPRGRLHNFCNFYYETRLQEARGYGQLKSIMHYLAERNGLRLVEIADYVQKHRSPVKQYLRALLNVDLIERLGYVYFVVDPVLAFWIKETKREPAKYQHRFLGASEIKELNLSYHASLSYTEKARIACQSRKKRKKQVISNREHTGS